MTRKYMAIKNKQQKHPNVNYRQYLRNIEEPYDSEWFDTPAFLQVELIDNRYNMKRRFRRIAQNMRMHDRAYN